MKTIYFELLVDNYSPALTSRKSSSISGFSEFSNVPLSSFEISRSRGLLLDLATVFRRSAWGKLRTATTHLRSSKQSPKTTAVSAIGETRPWGRSGGSYGANSSLADSSSLTLARTEGGGVMTSPMSFSGMAAERLGRSR